MGGKACLMCKGKTLLGVVNGIFTKGEGDGIEFRLPFKVFSTLKRSRLKNRSRNFLKINCQKIHQKKFFKLNLKIFLSKFV